MAVAVAGAPAVAAPDPSDPPASGPEAPTTAPTTTVPPTTTTTTTTVPLPDPGEPVHPPERGGLVPDARGGLEQLTDTLPPPTTTLPPNPCASLDVPANSGTGKRIVYSKACQRTWIIEADGTVARTYLVSGRLTWNQPTPNNPANQFEPQPRYYADPPAYYRVWSQSSYTCNIKRPYICWRYMVRFTKGPEGDNIGFHEIPINTDTGRAVQTVSQLGMALSSGCVRQAPEDALFLWRWVRDGDRVVVV